MAGQIGHISPSIVQQAITTVDAVEAQRSGGLRQLLKKAVDARSPQNNLRATKSNTSKPVIPTLSPNQTPEGQVSAAEQVQAFALRGRELDDKKLSGKFRGLFLTFTTGDSKFLELCIHSLLNSLDEGSRSVVDDLNTASPDEKTAIKLLLLQIVILDADQYAMTSEQVDRLISVRDRLLVEHNKSLEEFLLTASVASMAARPIKIGVKQLAHVNRMLAKGDSLDSVEIYNFLSRLVTSNPKNLNIKLKVLRENWLLLADREKTQYPLELTAQRQHFIQSRVRQIDQLLVDLKSFDLIANVCSKAGVSKVPESGRVLLELIGIVASQGVGSVNRLTRMFDAMAPAMKGTQIYCVNLRQVLSSGLIFSARQNEKTYFQVMQTITNALKSSYMHKPVQVKEY